MTGFGGRRILAQMAGKDRLLTEIATLLAEREGGDDPARLERTLTDGYARALGLEAKRLRLERSGGGREVARVERDLGVLRDQLGLLRRRHSAAVRTRAVG